jgi:hypothetical protein
MLIMIDLRNWLKEKCKEQYDKLQRKLGLGQNNGNMFRATTLLIILLLVFYFSGYSWSRGTNLMLKWYTETVQLKLDVQHVIFYDLDLACNCVYNLWRCWNCYVECHFNHTMICGVIYQIEHLFVLNVKYISLFCVLYQSTNNYHFNCWLLNKHNKSICVFNMDEKWSSKHLLTTQHFVSHQNYISIT